MRKKMITPTEQALLSTEADWINLESLVEVELSSEDAAFPIEAALLLDQTLGWRASEPGMQTIRLLFDTPLIKLSRILLHFEETEIERTQEYVLRWSADGGQSFQEIVRQQWNFNPQDATREIEDHHVDCQNVTMLELSLLPDIDGGSAIASLAKLRLT